MQSVMKHDFSRIPATDMPRSTFDRGHGLKTAFDSGYLVPVEVQECLPGDEIDFNGKFFARLAPTVTPVMDNVFLDFFAFFVPSRLVWTNFTKMMGERVNPSDSIDYVVPKITPGSSTGFAVGSLADYFGIPVGKTGIPVNALPFRAYAKIWDDWFRDENLQRSIIQSTDDLGDGNPNNINWNRLLRRGKRHDYFTSCLPTPQKGDGVNLPLGQNAPVIPNSLGYPLFFGHEGALPNYLRINGYPLAGKNDSSDWHDVSLAQEYDGTATDHVALKWSNKMVDGKSATGLEVDLSTATGATINSLRMAFQLQRLLEKDNRAGTRYVEILRAHFRTICPDARLQRSEFLGSSSTPINFFPVPQTSATNASSLTPQGNLVSNPQVYADLHFQKSCTEHGYLIVLANVRADLNYQQGLDRMWSRSTRYDFFWPVLQHLGEQAVLNQEIYCQNNSVVENGQKVNEQVFGYQERYAEYRYNPSHVTGRMRTDPNSDSLDIWHLAQYFTELPKLNASFIVDQPPLQRVLAVDDEPQIIMDAYLGQKWTRPMALYSVPGLIDHF